MEVYTESRGFATANRERRGGSPHFWRQIEAVKEGAKIERVAEDYGMFKPAGAGRLLGRCLSPDHEDRTSSMTIYTEGQRFKCYGCGESGDVLDLVRLVEGGELWEAMVSLGTRYGIPLLEKPPSWYARQERQKPLRSKIKEGRIEHVRLLVFRLLWMPWLRRLPESVREEATERAWRDSRWMAERIYAERRGA